jgi:hypothetical protein
LCPLESLLGNEAADSAARLIQGVAPTWYVQIAPLGKDDSSFDRALLEARASSQERMAELSVLPMFTADLTPT